MKNSTLRVKTETFVERANSWQEYYGIGHQLGEMGGLIRRMAMHIADLQKKVDRQAARLKRHNIGWIPCSERLPEEEGYYITSTCYNEVYCDYWKGDSFDRTEMIIAWMPLPEPYEGE